STACSPSGVSPLTRTPYVARLQTAFRKRLGRRQKGGSLTRFATEELTQGVHPLQVQVGVALPCDPDPAVDLNRLAHVVQRRALGDDAGRCRLVRRIRSGLADT